MTKPSRPKRSTADAAVFAFVEALLDDFFVDSDGFDMYQRFARGGRGTPGRADAIVSIGSFELADEGVAELNVRVGSPEVIVRLAHPRFNADIVAHYDSDAMQMTEARIDRFEGDRKSAAKCAKIWQDEILSVDEDDIESLNDALTDFMSENGQPVANDDAPGEPPLTADDTAMANALVTSLTREMRRRKPDLMACHDELLALEDSPQTLWPILDGYVAACNAAKRDDATLNAWLFLLESQLTLIRYRIDRGWDWASRMVENFQDKLIEIGRAKRVSPEDFTAMTRALGEAGIDVKPAVRRALADAGLTLPEPGLPADLAGLLTEMTNQLASVASNPFEVDAALNQATKVMPSEIRCFMAHEFARSPHPVVRDAVPLMLLSSDQDVRRAAATALEQTAVPATLSPETLRRMIAIRDWMPEADRPAIDQAIRAARLKSVDCAQWPAARDLMISASMIDGSGAQSIVLSGRGGRKGVLAGALLKLSGGVTDSWCDIDASRREINEVLATLRRTSDACEVGRPYLDAAIQHAIAKGTAVGRPPGSALLAIAELAGGEDWRARALDIAMEATRLFDALPADQRSPDSIEVSLRRSGAWIDEDFGDSWFLDDPDVRAIVGRGSRRDSARLVQRLMTEVMPTRRAEWAERFLLLALRAGATADRVRHAYANDFTILAHSLAGDRDLATIPLMTAIAKHTLEVVGSA